MPANFIKPSTPLPPRFKSLLLIFSLLLNLYLLVKLWHPFSPLSQSSPPSPSSLSLTATYSSVSIRLLSLGAEDNHMSDHSTPPIPPAHSLSWTILYSLPPPHPTFHLLWSRLTSRSFRIHSEEYYGRRFASLGW